MNYQNFQNLMLLTSSDTKRILMHLFLFTNSAQRELVSIFKQSIHDRKKLSLPYILDAVSPGVNSKTVSDKLWKDLNQENNEILKQVPEIS